MPIEKVTDETFRKGFKNSKPVIKKIFSKLGVQLGVLFFLTRGISKKSQLVKIKLCQKLIKNHDMDFFS